MPFTFPVLMVAILIKWSFQSVTSSTPLQRASNGPIIWRKGTSTDRIGTTQILKTGNVAAIESIISWWKSLLSTPGLFHSVVAATSLPFLLFFSWKQIVSTDFYITHALKQNSRQHSALWKCERMFDTLCFIGTRGKHTHKKPRTHCKNSSVVIHVLTGLVA